jgi:aminopeptidase N
LERERLEATVTTRVRALRATEAKLLMHAEDLEIAQVRDGEGRKLWHSYDGHVLQVRWEEGFAQGEERRVVVAYSVEKPVDGLFFSRPTAQEPGKAWYAATDHESERARHWLPCVDLPHVRVALDFHIRANERFVSLANGVKVGEEVHGGGSKTTHWRLEQRCPSYLICFAVGDLVEAKDGAFEGLELAYYTTRAFTEQDLLRSFGRTGEMLRWMVGRLGTPYPFPKYYQFALPHFGGAMENISLVSWDDIFVCDEVMAQEWAPLVDVVNVHEMAHSYFGDLVVCRDFAHAWLKESWATYMESCWLEHKLGPDEQRYDLYCNAQAYFSEADEHYKRAISTRVFDASWDMYDRHLYPGGACRLHVLRHELGDDTFWGAVQDYLAQFAHKTVETDDFRRVMEARSGRSLVRFFDQWFYSPGYPSLKVSFSYDDKAKEGTFEVEQTQPDPKAGVPVFHMSLDLGWVIGGALSTKQVALDKARHVFVVPMDADPEQVRVDPLGRALCKLDLNPGDDKLKRQLTEAQDVVGRILAGRELAASGRRRSVEAIRDAWAKEPFWGVKVEWAKALAKSKALSAIEALASILPQESDPLVLRHLIGALRGLRDERLAAAVADRAQTLGLYLARQAAWEVLGSQRAKAPLDALTAALREPSFQGLIQAGAARGLGASRQPAALPALLAATLPASALPPRARAAAADALATLSAALEEPQRLQVVERFVDLLRDPSRPVRQAAALALTSMKAPEALAALEAYRAPLSHQDRVKLGRAIADLRASGQGAPALEKELDEARKELRKLADRVELLEAKAKP